MTTLPPPIIGPIVPTLSKWQREQAAFVRLLPQLLVTQRGKFVAIHDEQPVAFGDDKLELALRVLSQLGNIDIFVGLVSDDTPVAARSGVRREIRPI